MSKETSVQIHQSVRDEDVFILQSPSPPDINDHLMELLVMISGASGVQPWPARRTVGGVQRRLVPWVAAAAASSAGPAAAGRGLWVRVCADVGASLQDRLG